MQENFRVGWWVRLDGQIDGWDIEASRCQVSGKQQGRRGGCGESGKIAVALGGREAGVEGREVDGRGRRKEVALEMWEEV